MRLHANHLSRITYRARWWLTVACLGFLAGCSRGPVTGVTPLKAANPADLQKYLLAHKPDVDAFRLRGPFRVTERPDLEIMLSANVKIAADLFLCAATE